MQLRITSRKKLTSLLCALGLISIVAIYPRQTVNFFRLVILCCIGFIPECQCQRLTITKAAIVRCSPPGVEVVNRTNTVTNFQRVGLG